MNDQPVEIRAFEPSDATAVFTLFIAINRAIAPADQVEAFERYIARSIIDEIGDIPAYYHTVKGAGFWVAMQGENLVGFFGLESVYPGTAELRRMYVAPEYRRRGLGRRLLAEAEEMARQMGYHQIDLSTSELQNVALALYRRTGYEEIGEVIAETPSNKTVGGGIRRYHFAKRLDVQSGGHCL